MLKKLTVILALSLLPIGPVGAQTIPDQSIPRLRIKSPFAGPVWRVGVDPSETFVFASSAYSSVTVWPAASQNAATTLRAPLRDEQHKKAAPAAISPDGEFIAYGVPPMVDGKGGLQAHTSNIYVFRRSTGRIIHTIGKPEDAVASRPQAMRFSPDGSYLAAVLSDGCGLRVWSTKDWKLAASDDIGYGDGGGKGRCCNGDGSHCDQLLNAIDLQFFNNRNDGAWLITSSDTGVRVYGHPKETAFLRSLITPGRLGLARPAAIAISPDGKRIAIGDSRDKTSIGRILLRVALLDASSFLPVGESPFEVTERVLLSDALLQNGPDVPDMQQASFERVAWLDVGGRSALFAGGFLPCHIIKSEFLRVAPINARQSCLLRIEFVAGKEQWKFLPLDSERVMDMVQMPRHAGILVATQRSIALIDADGEPIKNAAGEEVFYQANDAADLREALLDLKISPDGKIVEFLDYRSTKEAPVRVTFDAKNLRVKLGDSAGLASVKADQDDAAVTIDRWRNEPRPPRVVGVQLSGAAYSRSEFFRAISRLEKQELLLLGSSEFLRLYSYAKNTPKLLCQLPITEETYRVVITPDAKLAVTAHSDGTLRWYHISGDANQCRFDLLLSVYLNEVRPNVWTWTAWQPTGIFARGVASRAILEWQTGDANGQINRTSFEQVTTLYNWAEVAKSLDPKAVPAREMSAFQNAKLIEANAEKILVQILPEPNPNVADTEKMRFRVKIDDVVSLPKTLRMAMADGTAVPLVLMGQSVAANSTGIKLEATQLNRGVAELEFALPQSARSKHGGQQFCFFVDEVRDVCQVISWEGEIAKVERRRLRAILIGMAGNKQQSLRLKFADNDVIDVANLFIHDFEASMAQGPTRASADYQDLHIDLIVSPYSEEGEKELARLKTKSFVTIRPPTKAGIFEALEDAVADQADVATFPDDLVLLYFSGHGTIVWLDEAPNGATETVFATTETLVEPASLLASGLRGSELLKFFKQIRGQKLVIFDACRSLGVGSKVMPFDPAKIKMQFEPYMDVHFFFSSDRGQPSYEVDGLAFDKTRAASRLGNSLFSYAILDALTNPDVAIHGGKLREVVKIRRVADFLENSFFNTDDKDSESIRLKALHPEWKYIPQPQLSVVKDPEANKVIRSLPPREH